MFNFLVCFNVILNITYVGVFVYIYFTYSKLYVSLQSIKALLIVDNARIAETISRIQSLNRTLNSEPIAFDYIPIELGTFFFKFGFSTFLIVLFLISLYYTAVFLGGYISWIPDIFSYSQAPNIFISLKKLLYGVGFIEGFDIYGNKIHCVIEGKRALVSFIPHGSIESTYISISDIGLVYSNYLKFRSGLISEEELARMAELAMTVVF